MSIHSQSRWLIGIPAVAVLIALAALLLSSPALASNDKVDGVRARVHKGTLDVKSGGRDNVVALRLQAGNTSQIQIDVGDDGSADFTVPRADVQEISVKMGDGNDTVRIDDANGAFTDAIPTTIAGGDGDDSLNGGLGAETFRGGDGDDTAFGRKGADSAILGEGDDTFRWDNGDGSDTIEGQGGSDTMLFNGATGNETVTMSAVGERLLFFRTQGNVRMDTDGVEIVDFNALTGADSITVNDLSGTDVTQTNVDLAGTLGGANGDNAQDSVVVNGTEGVDTIDIARSGSAADVTGLATAVSVEHADQGDSLSIDTRGGDDITSVSGVAGVLQVLLDGQAL